MILQELSYVKVAVSAIAYFAVGSVWFSPIGFSKVWSEGHGISMDRSEEGMAKMKKEMPMFMLKTLILCFIGTISLACLMGISEISNLCAGIKLGLAVSVFPFTSIAMSHMYTRKSFKLTLIDSGYHVVGLTIASIILSVWH